MIKWYRCLLLNTLLWLECTQKMEWFSLDRRLNSLPDLPAAELVWRLAARPPGLSRPSSAWRPRSGWRWRTARQAGPGRWWRTWCSLPGESDRSGWPRTWASSPQSEENITILQSCHIVTGQKWTGQWTGWGKLNSKWFPSVFVCSVSDDGNYVHKIKFSWNIFPRMFD